MENPRKELEENDLLVQGADGRAGKFAALGLGEDREEHSLPPSLPAPAAPFGAFRDVLSSPFSSRTRGLLLLQTTPEKSTPRRCKRC